MDCIFCKLIDKDIPSVPVYEDDDYIVLNDLHPKARIHMLIIPKKHIETISHIEDSDSALIGGMFLLARNLSKDMGISGYKLQFNVGKDGGQEIFHIHLHFLAK